MISISPRRVFVILTAVACCLTVLSVTGHALQFFYGKDHFRQLVRLFNISGEGNVAAWFSSANQLACALVLLTIARLTQQRGGRYVGHWLVLSLAFLYISIDDTAQIHELLIDPLHALFHTSGIFLFAWVIPGLVVVFALALAYLGFLAHLPRRTRVLFVVAGLIYVGGALGVELVSGYVADYLPDDIILRGAVATAEDVGELMGIIVFLYTLLDYVGAHFGSVVVAPSAAPHANREGETLRPAAS